MLTSLKVKTVMCSFVYNKIRMAQFKKLLISIKTSSLTVNTISQIALASASTCSDCLSVRLHYDEKAFQAAHNAIQISMKKIGGKQKERLTTVSMLEAYCCMFYTAIKLFGFRYFPL